jgi:hypothetical protein
MEGRGGGDSPSGDPCPQQPQLAGMYRWVWKLANGISKLADIPIIGVVQAHQWMVHCGEVDREPTNEELDLTTNLPVSYGAKGLIYELYDGYAGPNGLLYWYGLTETDGVKPRYTNVYGQPKWEKFKSIVQRLKTWGPTLMSFDNTQTNSYIYRLESERDQMYRDNSYIHALRTFKPGNEQLDCSQDNLGFENPEGLIFDCPDSTYLQAATFKPGSFQANTNYFMVVNRRCSPIKEGYPDGKRDVRILFYQDHSAFDNHQVWEIVDLFNNSTVAKFDKSIYAMQDLGDFMPGEGRLYKIVPVP